MTDALTVRGLGKSFGAITVARMISLSLARGSRHALIGPNGAGKTTFVGMLSGVIRADGGDILLNGASIIDDPVHTRVRKGLVRTFQVSSLFRNLSVMENISLAVAQHAGLSFGLWTASHKRSDVADKAAGIVDLLQLGAVMSRSIGEIAYGQQRLVELAIALALEPKVLLLDEPAAGIPSGEVDRLLEAVETLPEDIAILFIEHDMQVVRRIATTVSVLVHGEMLITGAPEDVMSSPLVQEVYLGKSGVRRFEETQHDA